MSPPQWGTPPAQVLRISLTPPFLFLWVPLRLRLDDTNSKCTIISMLSCHYHKDCYLRSSLTCGLRFLLNITLNIWPQLVAVRPLVGSSGWFVWLLPTIFCSPALCSTIPHIQVFEAMCNNTPHPGIEAMCTYRYPIFPGVSRNMLATSAFARVRTEVLLQEEAYSSRCTNSATPERRQ